MCSSDLACTTVLDVDTTNGQVGVGAVPASGCALYVRKDQNDATRIVSENQSAGNLAQALFLLNSSGADVEFSVQGSGFSTTPQDVRQANRANFLLTAGTELHFATINTSQALVFDVTNALDNTNGERFRINNTTAVVNDTQKDVDFRVATQAGANGLFVEGSSGNVGVGIGGVSSPQAKLHVSDPTLSRVLVTSDADSQIQLESGGGPTAYPAWVSYGHRGTIASPSATQSGDTLGGFFFGGYMGAYNTARVTLEAYASETWSASGIGSGMVFKVMPAATATFTISAT